MGVRRDLERCDGDLFLAASLTPRPRSPDVVRADPQRGATAQVRQRERGHAVAAEGRAQQREQSLVLVDRQDLAGTLHPILRREAEAKDLDLTQKRASHGSVLSDSGLLDQPRCGKMPLRQMQ